MSIEACEPHSGGMPARIPKACASFVALALLVTSCSSSDGGDGDEPGASTKPSSSSVSRAVDPPTEDDFVAAMARGGIETFADTADPDPVAPADDPGPMSLTGWQAKTMQRQLAAGRGYLGRDLDALTAEVADGVPTSVVLAAWISVADTEAAGVARELMGERDYAHFALDIVYPDAVVALFVNDLASQDGPGTEPTASPAAYVARVPAAPAGICSDLVSFLSGSLDSIVQSLQVQVSGAGAGAVLASIWNTVVSIAASAAKVALGALTSALIAPVTRAITLVAVLTEAASLLDPWSISTTVAPADSLGPSTEAVVTSDVHAALEFEWPADLKDCASTLSGVTLPDLGDVSGSPVTWQYDDFWQLTTQGETDATLDAAGTARLRFATKPPQAGETDETSGSPVAYPLHVRTDAERTQVKKLTDLIADLLLGALPAPARAIVDKLLGPVKSATQAKLAELVSTKGKTLDVQLLRFQQKPDPVPPTVEGCTVGATTSVPDGTWKGPIVMSVKGQGLTGQAFSGGQGQLTMVVKNGKVKSGTWGVSWHSSGKSSEGGITAVIEIDGEVGGGVKGNAGKPLVTGGWTISGTATVNVGGTTTIPLEFSGKASETMTIEEADCAELTGTFIPSFNAKGSPATFTGTARWSGTRVG